MMNDPSAYYKKIVSRNKAKLLEEVAGLQVESLLELGGYLEPENTTRWRCRIANFKLSPQIGLGVDKTRIGAVRAALHDYIEKC